MQRTALALILLCLVPLMTGTGPPVSGFGCGGPAIPIRRAYLDPLGSGTVSGSAHIAFWNSIGSDRRYEASLDIYPESLEPAFRAVRLQTGSCAALGEVLYASPNFGCTLYDSNTEQIDDDALVCDGSFNVPKDILDRRFLLVAYDSTEFTNPIACGEVW